MRTIATSDRIVAPGEGLQFADFNVSSHSPEFIVSWLVELCGYYLNAVFITPGGSERIEIEYWRLENVDERDLVFRAYPKDLDNSYPIMINGTRVNVEASLRLPLKNLRAINIPP